MCCDITEDCTNDYDDNDNSYIDCIDPICHSSESVCGASTTHGTYYVVDDNGDPVIDPLTGEQAVSNYYCSKGRDEINNPLPAYMEDMDTDHHLTRHCCEIGAYWDPTATPEPHCIDADPCYSPIEPDAYNCNYDVMNSTQFEDWANDANIQKSCPNPR